MFKIGGSLNKIVATLGGENMNKVEEDSGKQKKSNLLSWLNHLSGGKVSPGVLGVGPEEPRRL